MQGGIDMLHGITAQCQENNDWLSRNSGYKTIQENDNNFENSLIHDLGILGFN